MNKYRIHNCAYKIDGYYNPPDAGGDANKKFLSAKSQLIENLRIDLEIIEKMTLEEFLIARKSSFVAHIDPPDRY
jgi:hypothetical protein